MSDDYETFECVNCLGTYTGEGWNEAYKIGWRKHQFGSMGGNEHVEMCSDCEQRFAERRKVKAQFNALVADAGLAGGDTIAPPYAA